MRIYLDLCCLKRPFDSKDQPIIRLQAEAVGAILDLPPQDVVLLRTPAQILENNLDPHQTRRDAVSVWLAAGLVEDLNPVVVSRRMADLIALGFKKFDAFHLASAESAGASVFLSVDIALIKLALRASGELRFRVMDPVRFLEELNECIP